MLEYRRGLIERLVSEGSPTKRLKHVESLIRSLNGRSYEKGPKTKIRVGTNAFPFFLLFDDTNESDPRIPKFPCDFNFHENRNERRKTSFLSRRVIYSL